ncbi:MAG TPA: thioesterase family protein [Noviherbaspirillum sp.]|nr:thioesterase family protein [Noviherbaspirillum sp.]
MAAFRTEIPVRFADCDPAGIVFYPRYFEMFNAIVEDWCAQGWGIDFHELIVERGWGLPTVRIETDFVAPSRLGERLTAQLEVARIGGASIEILLRLLGPDGSDRVRSRQVLVLTDRTQGRARSLPAELRERVARFVATD